MTKIFFARILSLRTFSPRLLSAFSPVCLPIFLTFLFVLALSLSFSPLALATEHETKDEIKASEDGATTEESDVEIESDKPRKDKVERKLERAKRLEEKGKLKKSRKVLTKALITEYKAQRKYERALELKKKGKLRKYKKKVRRSAKLGSEEAARELMISFDDEDVSSGEAAATNEQQEIYALIGETLESPYSAEARLGDADALYKIGKSFLDGAELDGAELDGAEQDGGAKDGAEQAGAAKSDEDSVEDNLSVSFAMFLHAEKRGSGRASNELSILLPELSIDDIELGRDVYREWRSIIKDSRKARKKEMRQSGSESGSDSSDKVEGEAQQAQ